MSIRLAGFKTLASAMAILMPFEAFAWDGTITGSISNADVTDGPNYAFRVSLQGTPALCGNSNTWAYVNRDNINYGAYVAALLSAKVSGTPVTVYSMQDETGYCKIGYVSVRP